MAFGGTEDLDELSFVLAGFYFLLCVIPSVQLVRIHFRAPKLGWTMQKAFLLLTLVTSVGSSSVVGLTFQYPIFTILDDTPRALFFTTYTLLVLFWAEIIYHARNRSYQYIRRLRPAFSALNLLVYICQITFWVLLFVLSAHEELIAVAGCVWLFLPLLILLSNVFFSILYLLTAAGFLFYGGKLFLMLRRFPIESKGRTSKLKEVGWVSLICTTCFTIRAILLLYTSFASSVDNNLFVVFGYYLVVEILPSSLVLFILRKLPPRRESQVTPYNPYSRVKASGYGAGATAYAAGANAYGAEANAPRNAPSSPASYGAVSNPIN